MSDNVLVIYHDADYDGKCSAAIVAGAFGDVDFYGFDHYREINWTLVERYKTVVMVDISFPTIDDMNRVNSVCDFIWIDHHQTQIDEYGKYNFKGLQEVGKGACQLCWEYFFPHLDVPKGIKYLADYDIWDHSDQKTLPFQYGMRYIDIQAEDKYSWKDIFNEGLVFNQVVEVGNICYNFQTTSNKYLAKSSFEVEFQGHKCIAINGGRGSLVFESVGGRDYDIMITFNYFENAWAVSLYNEDGNCINVGEIAKYFGGGGHKHAAGFKCTTDQLIKLGLIT